MKFMLMDITEACGSGAVMTVTDTATEMYWEAKEYVAQDGFEPDMTEVAILKDDNTMDSQPVEEFLEQFGEWHDYSLEGKVKTALYFYDLNAMTAEQAMAMIREGVKK